jgi:parallel beta-helix repeat protein
MAELAHYQGQVTSASADSKLQPVASRTVLVTRRGATVDGAHSGTKTAITVLSGALRFSDNDVIMVEDDATQVAQVNGTPTSDTSIPVDSVSITLADGDRLVNLKADTPGAIDYAGYNGIEFIYTDPTGATAVTNNQVTTNSDGEYGFWAHPDYYDITVLDSDGAISTNSQTIPDEHVGVFGTGIIRLEAEAATVDGALAINAAITTISGRGGGIVELGPGIFTIQTYVAAAANVWLRGCGMDNTIIQTKANTAITSMGYLGTATIDYFKVSDLTIDGNDINQASGNATGISMRNTNVLVVDSVEVKNLRGIGIIANANDQNVKLVRISNCYVHNTGTRAPGGSDYAIGTGAANGKTVDDVIIVNNHIEQGGKDSNGVTNYGETSTIGGSGINISSTGVTTSIIIDGNTITEMESGGIRIGDDVGTETHNISITNNVIQDIGRVGQTDGGNGIFCSVAGEILIDGNSVDGVTDGSDNGIEYAGIAGGASGRNVISNNRCTGVASAAKSGITVLSHNNVVVSGNLCHDNGGHGISSNPSITGINSITIVGNVCDSNVAGAGINCGARHNMDVSSNVCRNNGTQGIVVGSGAPAVEEVDNIVVNGNICCENTDAGIRVVMDGSYPGDGITIDGNVCQGNTERGIVLGNMDEFTISNNVVTDNGLSGIGIGTANNGVVSGNLIRGNGTAATASSDDGILFSAATTNTDILIDGNVIVDHTNTGAIGINVGGAATMTNVGVTSSNVFGGNDTGDIVSTLTSIASADPLVIPWGQTYFNVTGTTNFNTITVTNPGHIVTLKFAGILDIASDDNVKLSATPYTTSANDTLTLVCDGTNWYEMARSVNN